MIVMPAVVPAVNDRVEVTFAWSSRHRLPGAREFGARELGHLAGPPPAMVNTPAATFHTPSASLTTVLRPD
jgi:hypothetical protein